MVYSDHKRAVARQHPYDIYAYMDGKDALIKQLLAEALAWQREGATLMTYTVDSMQPSDWEQVRAIYSAGDSDGACHLRTKRA